MKTRCNINRRLKKTITTFAMTILLGLCSCENFVEVDEPFGQIPDIMVFENKDLATAALTTIYSKLREDVLLTGNTSGINVLLGLYADELDYYGNPGHSLEKFYLHEILPSNSIVKSLWNNTYNVIYRANAVIDGLENSTAIPQVTKNQLSGEALFIRALAHFYLVNLFDDIPYIKTTDYRVNSEVARMEEIEVYEMIVQDLLKAKSVVDDNYVTPERTRPNLTTVSALLARVYLYQESWELAEQESSSIISNIDLYQLESELQGVFLKESTATIWQFKPKIEGFNTNEAPTFIFNSGPPPSLALSHSLVNSMEKSDLRKVHWIKAVSNGTDSSFHSYKYQTNQNTGASVEYSIIFRLSEQYLIRSEARAMLGDMTGALQDLNTIRNRSGLRDITVSSLDELRLLLLNERRHEFFTEFGHRWFDMKRMGYADEIIAPIKPGWNLNNVHLPIPESELLINPNLNPQNNGY